MVPMQTGPAVRAEVPTDGQTFVHQDAAARTGLRGERRRHGYDRLPSLTRFERQDGQKCTPARIADALGEGMVPDHVGRLQLFVIDGVVLADQRQRGLAVEVRPRPAYVLMGLR